MSVLFRSSLAAMAIALSACAPEAPSAAIDITPAMRWDFHPQAPAWTAATLRALEGEGAALVETLPADIETFCPGYAENGAEERAAFWAGLLSALAKHESTWNPAAAGGGGRWIGLLQISPQTADHYGCAADTVAELKDGSANLSCAVRIAAVQVGRDRLVAGGGNRGVGRDWAPFRSSEKRDDIARWTREQSYCQPG
jgi:ABC-type proline/glycine betaine transport system substrate-binding protein